MFVYFVVELCAISYSSVFVCVRSNETFNQSGAIVCCRPVVLFVSPKFRIYILSVSEGSIMAVVFFFFSTFVCPTLFWYNRRYRCLETSVTIAKGVFIYCVRFTSLLFFFLIVFTVVGIMRSIQFPHCCNLLCMLKHI